MKPISGRPKKCKWCGGLFVPARTFQTWCGPDCAVPIAKEKRKKEKRAELKQKRAALKTRADWLREAQTAFNAYIRIRDRGRPCISCGKPDDGSHQRHASHFRSVGAAAHLRFNPLNVHASCAQCNNIKSGNLIEYALRLPSKIGQEKADELAVSNEERKFSIEEARRIKTIFNKKKIIYGRLFRK